MQATGTQASAPTLLSHGIAAGLSIRPFFSRSQDDEDIVADFPTFGEAVTAKKEAGEGDVIKRLDDGTLTTEF